MTFLLTGCFEETAIRSYSIAKPEPVGNSETSDRPAQLLGLIVPHDQSAWFFKITDDPAKVEKIIGDFRELASSLTFSEDGTPQWKLAQGWEERVLKQITYAQFSNAEGATVTLTQLGADTKDPTKWQVYLKDNINRWRQQLGLSPQEWTEIESSLEEVPTHSTGSAKAYFVSLLGKQGATGGAMRGAAPPMVSQQPIEESSPAPDATSSIESPTSEPPQRPRLAYQVPDGWQEQPSSGIRLAAFQISSQSETATVSVSTAGGQLDQSVGMWMQQVGLEPADERVKQLIEASSSGDSPLGPFRCYTIEGAADEKSVPAMTIRVAVIPLSEQESLFVKLTGEKQLVAAEILRFDQFVRSLNWQ